MKHTLKSVRTLAATLIAIGSLAGGANAATSIPLIQFSGAETVIDFQTPATNETLITTQYLGLGVSFSGSLYTMQNSGDTQLFPSNGDGQIASNWRYSGSGLQGLQFEISLNTIAHRIGFYKEQGASVSFSISLFNQAVFVDTVNFSPVAGPSVQFAGVEELSGFNRAVVTVSGGNGFIAIDNLRVESVPEPSSAIIAGLGLLGLASRRRRTQ